MGERTQIEAIQLAALSLLSIPLLAAAALPASAASAASQASSPAQVLRPRRSIDEPLCQSNKSMCVDAATNTGGKYVGHDEPSL